MNPLNHNTFDKNLGNFDHKEFDRNFKTVQLAVVAIAFLGVVFYIVSIFAFIAAIAIVVITA